MNSIIEDIRNRKGYPKKHEQGAVMLTAKMTNYPSLEGINIYYPKNKDHFWLGVVNTNHATLHHGFDLEKYESKEEWEKDVRRLIPESLTEEGYVSTTPHWFPSNLPDEDEYYFVVPRFEPSEKMRSFRQNLLATFPHTSSFPTWQPHVSIVSAADKESRDTLMKRIEEMKVKIEDLHLSFNKPT